MKLGQIYITASRGSWLRVKVAVRQDGSDHWTNLLLNLDCATGAMRPQNDAATKVWPAVPKKAIREALAAMAINLSENLQGLRPSVYKPESKPTMEDMLQ